MRTYVKFIVARPEEPLDTTAFIKTDKEKFKLNLLKKQVRNKLVSEHGTKRPLGRKQFSYHLTLN